MWWHSSATISPYPAVSSGDVVAAGQGLQGDDVDGAAQLRAAAAELAGLDAEELSDPGPPLVGQGLAVDQDKRGDLVGGDDRAGHDGLPAPGGATSTPRSCRASSVTASCWAGVKTAAQVKSWAVPGERVVGDVQAASGLRGQGGDASRACRAAGSGRRRWSPRSSAGTAGCSRWRRASAAARRTPGCASTPRAAASPPAPASARACSSRIPASSRTLRTGGAGGLVAVDEGADSRVTSVATVTFPARSAARLSSCGVIRPRVDR